MIFPFWPSQMLSELCWPAGVLLPSSLFPLIVLLWEFQEPRHLKPTQWETQQKPTVHIVCTINLSPTSVVFFAPKELEIVPMCEGEPVKQIRTLAALLPLLTGAREKSGPSDPCDFNPPALLCVVFLHPPVSPPHVHE